MEAAQHNKERSAEESTARVSRALKRDKVDTQGTRLQQATLTGGLRAVCHVLAGGQEAATCTCLPQAAQVFLEAVSPITAQLLLFL